MAEPLRKINHELDESVTKDNLNAKELPRLRLVSDNDGADSEIIHQSEKMMDLEMPNVWHRLGAYIIDMTLSFTLTSPFTVVMARMTNGFEGFAPGWEFVLNSLVGMVVQFIYFGWFYKSRGATPGKIVFDLKVVSQEGEVTYFKTFLREIVGKTLFFFIWLPLCGLAFIKKDKRTLMDRWLKLTVTYAPPLNEMGNE